MLSEIMWPTKPANPAGNLSKAMKRRPGEKWTVWCDRHDTIYTCRDDGNGIWATPVGHLPELIMRANGWIKADGSEEREIHCT
jgi:hypothetical protein